MTRERSPMIYVAGPYTQGSLDVNIRRAVACGDVLVGYGAAPFIPHLFHFWELMCPRPYEEWLDLDLDMVERCDALVRIEGESPGAEREILHAKEWSVPVFHVRFTEGQFLDIPVGLIEWIEDWRMREAGT